MLETLGFGFGNSLSSWDFIFSNCGNCWSDNIATVMFPSPAGFGPFEFAMVYLNSLAFIDNKNALVMPFASIWSSSARLQSSVYFCCKLWSKGRRTTRHHEKLLKCIGIAGIYSESFSELKSWMLLNLWRMNLAMGLKCWLLFKWSLYQLTHTRLSMLILMQGVTSHS